MLKFVSLVIGFLCVVLIGAERLRYDGYQVIQVHPTNEDQLEFLNGLKEIPDVIPGYDFFKYVRPASFAIGPNFLEFVKFQLRSRNLEFNIIYEDMQEIIDQQINDNNLRKESKMNTNFNVYNDLQTIEAQLVEWDNNCPSGLSCELYSIGKTYENNDIWTFRVGPAAGASRAVYIDGTMHAREWITTATMFRMVDHLMTTYGSDDTVTDLLNTYDFYLTVVYNPDGYDFSWTNVRLWRKNREPGPEGRCIGTDLNRNFPYKWGIEGVSHDECDDLYCGEGPGSEIETQLFMADIFRIQETQEIIAYANLHSFGNMWMFPWGNTVDHAGVVCERTDDYDDLMQVAEATADAIENTYGTRWDRGTSCEVIYETTGAVDDWSKGLGGVKYPFNPELRGAFFITSEDNIELSFNEVWNGVVAMVNEIEIVEGF